MADYCPNCERVGIAHGVCRNCGVTYRVGALLHERRRIRYRITLPSVREATPSRLPMVMRERSSESSESCFFRMKREAGYKIR